MWNDNIFIDSTGTESSPYDCLTDLSQWIHINKSLSFFGHPLRAHVACHAGLYFMNPNNTKLQIEIVKLSFKSTRLKFRASSVNISNCFIHDGKDPVEVFPDQWPYTLVVENTTFMNNDECVRIYASKNVESKFDLKIVVIIKETIFVSNCLRRNLSDGCIISLYSLDDIAGSIDRNSSTIVSSFTNLTFFENKGPLLLFNNSKGTFQGQFSDIRVMKSVHFKRGLNSKQSSLFAVTTSKASLSFVDVFFASNHGYRCLSIEGKHIALNIRDSRFLEHKIESNGGVLSFDKSHRLFVNIENTEFSDCHSNMGGAYYFSKKNKEINFIARNVSFNRCTASDSGGAIEINGDKADLFLENVTFFKCIASGEGGGGVSINVNNVCLTLFHTIWKACYSSFGFADALAILVTTGNVRIGHSYFDDIQLDPTASQFYTVYIYATQNNAGSLEVYDTKFLNCPYAIWTIDTISVNLTRVHFSRVSIFALNILTNTFQSDAHVYVDQCVFKNSTGGISLFLQDAKIVNVTIKNSNFSKFSCNKYGVGGQAIYILAKNVINSSISSFVLLENLLVEENSFMTYFPDAAVSVDLSNFIARDGNIVMVTKSRFYKNHNLETSSGLNGKAGALLVTMPADNMTSPGCVIMIENPEIHRKWHYKNKVLIVNTSFENNIGVTGALYITNGDTMCINCLFKNNLVRSSGQVHIGESSGKLELINSTLLETRAGFEFYPQNTEGKYRKSTFIFSYSAGPLWISGTKFTSEISKQSSPAIIVSKGGELSMTNESLLVCPTGSKIVKDDFSHFVSTENQGQPCIISVTVITLSCQACPGGTYSLQRGNSTNFSTPAPGFYCLACPYGADCDRNVVAKTNFWGYEISHNPPQLEFYTCPAGYCVTPNVLDTAVYNGCYGNREGKLCGKCKQGYTEELMSTSCIEQIKCDSALFWNLLFAFSFLVALYFLFKPNISRFIHKQIMWFKRRDDEVILTDAGYIKIIFYFYQIAGILLLETYVGLIEKTKILSTIISAFSFHVTFGSSGAIGCPFVGMTPVTKVLFTNIGVLTILLCIFIIFIIHKIFCKVRGSYVKEMPYLAAVLELLLLGYANIAKATLKLLTCVRVGSESILFLEGNTPCWQWWQAILGTVVVLFMIPFIVVLYWGSKKGYEQKLSPKEILLALVLPVPYIMYTTYKFIKSLCRQQEDPADMEEQEREDSSQFTDVLYGPFRVPTDDTKGTLYWESVLVGRRLVLLSIHALVVDPLLRLFSLSLTCVAIFYHHLLVFPFKKTKGNHLEAISLLALIVIANINLCKAALWSAGVTPFGPNLTHIKILEWTEVVLLALLPSIFGLLLVCFVLSLLLRLGLCLVQGITICLSSLNAFVFVQDDRPLLDN